MKFIIGFMLVLLAIDIDIGINHFQDIKDPDEWKEYAIISFSLNLIIILVIGGFMLMNLWWIDRF